MQNNYTIKYKGGSFDCKIKGIQDDKLILEPASSLFKGQNMERMSEISVEVQSTTEKVLYTSALPVSAIVHKDNKDYIYIVNKKQGFWEEEYRVEEHEVYISIYNDLYAALSTPLADDTIVLDRWDRTIMDGQRVYEYAQ
ncbi:MAG: hypothetical protein ACOX6S_01645 [Clostridia bacterium]|jgi:hypothetical protein